MHSLFEIISEFFVSILSMRRVPVRVQTQIRRVSKISHAMKFLLPLAFVLAMGVGAPSEALADPPRTAGEGMFDCMPGGLDWGCQVMGYLFEDKGLSSNKDLFGTSGGTVRTTPLNPTSVQTALRATMGFFSNAMLIIASLMLLYHLIVMVAETAHTGTIGGKEANQLWAPIRLVIAIGLLVPLSDANGMNSGQYIVVQIAKWGAGLGSQTWKVFIDKMADKQTFALPNSPLIRGIFAGALKIYMCQEIYNYWADEMKLSSDRVVGIYSPPPNDLQTRTFSNNSGYGGRSCGIIGYEYPNRDSVDELTRTNMDVFKRTEDIIQRKAKDLAKKFVGDGAVKELPSTEYLDQLIADYQVDLVSQITNLAANIGKNKYQEIMNAMKDAANTYGWMSAGSWFLALTRAQGQIINASNTLPGIRQEPDENALALLDPKALAAYKRFLQWAANSAKGFPTGNPGIRADLLPERTITPPTWLNTGRVLIQKARNNSAVSVFFGTISLTFGTTLDDAFTEYSKFLNKSPREAAEWIFKEADNLAKQYDVWQSHGGYNEMTNLPANVGATTNPFAELIALGHRNLEAGMEFWGAAMLFAAQTIGGQFLVSLIPSAGASAANLVSTVGLGATALFIFFAVMSLLAGVYLAFMIPLMPFIRFFYAIITWIAAVAEAILCIPFFALAHLTPKGEGFTGQKTKFGYIMLFQILVRPALMIFGLIASLLLFYVAVKFLNVMYYQAVAGLGNFQTIDSKGDAHSGGVGFMARIIVSIIYVALIYVSANMSFKMIDHLPRRALHWFGDQATEEQYHDEQNTIGQVASGISSEISGNLVNIPSQLGQTGRQIRLR